MVDQTKPEEQVKKVEQKKEVVEKVVDAKKDQEEQQNVDVKKDVKKVDDVKEINDEKQPSGLQPNPNKFTPSLYVGDLAPDVTQHLLFEIFSAVGPVLNVHLCCDYQTRRSLGYAYVNFLRVEDAETSLDTLNFTEIQGKQCRIMWAQKGFNKNDGNIFIKGLKEDVDNRALNDLFSTYGNILSCKIITNKQDGKSLGYGFVQFETGAMAKEAIEKTNGTKYLGQKLTVVKFVPKKERGGLNTIKYTNVYAKQFPNDIKEEEVRKVFTDFGNVDSFKLCHDKQGRPFCFVNFTKPEDAARAVAELHEKKEYDGQKCYVQPAQKRDNREKMLRERYNVIKKERQKSGVNLFVKYLAESIDSERLRKEFSEFGSIQSATVMQDNSGKSKGFGFVCFSTPEEATRAVTSMNHKIVEGKHLYVSLAQSKEQRRALFEAQAARNKMMAQHMYPQHPMFFPGPQRQFYGQMMGRRQMMGPQNFRPFPPQRMQKGNNRQFKFTQSARNFNQNVQPNNQQVLNNQQLKLTSPQQLQAIANMTNAEEQKEVIGTTLFQLASKYYPGIPVSKVTGMFLQHLTVRELLGLLESKQLLDAKIREALEVLENAGKNDNEAVEDSAEEDEGDEEWEGSASDEEAEEAKEN